MKLIAIAAEVGRSLEVHGPPLRKAEILKPLARNLKWVAGPPWAAHLAKVRARVQSRNQPIELIAEKLAPFLVDLDLRPFPTQPNHSPSRRQIDRNHAYSQGRPQGDPRGMKSSSFAARTSPPKIQETPSTRRYQELSRLRDFTISNSTGTSRRIDAGPIVQHFGGNLWLINLQ